MIEALACGTPVIGWRNGSVPEIIEDGVTGFVADDMEQAVRGVEQITELSRWTCRKAFEERFDASRMAADYVDVYRRLRYLQPDSAEQAVHSFGAPDRGINGGLSQTNVRSSEFNSFRGAARLIA
jgi:hypothetical protein